MQTKLFEYDPSIGEEVREKLDTLVSNIKCCDKCKYSNTRNLAVPGEGDITSDVYIVGECPGPDEDASGRPFVGRAGKLLREVLIAVGTDFSKVYITNIVRCKPSRALNPDMESVRICSKWLTKQLDLVRPSIILSVGRFSSAYFLKTKPEKVRITKNSGKHLIVDGINVFPVLHPSYVLRATNQMTEDKYIEHFFNFMRFL